MAGKVERKVKRAINKLKKRQRSRNKRVKRAKNPRPNMRKKK